MALAFCLPALVIQAHQTAYGRVLDAATGSGILSATILFSTGYQTTADSTGWFALPAASGKVLKLTISSIGYQTLSTSYSGESGEIIFRLEKSSRLMQPVEIKAVRAAESAPFTKTTLSAREIAEQNAGQDLPFLLNQVPGVVAYADAGNGIGYTGMRIRGTDPTRINITLNGIPYNDAESQGVFFVNLPDFVSSVSSIQVQRGAGTSTNGAGAFGASLHLATNDLREKAYAELNNSFGSFNSWKNTFMAGSGLMDGHFTFDARLSHISSDGYIDRASSKLKSFYLSGAWLNENSSVRLNFFSGQEKTYQAWYGIPEDILETNRTYNPAGMEKPGEPYDNETDNYRQDHYQLFFNHRFSDRLQFQTALFYTKGRGYYEQYKAEEDYADYGLEYPISGPDTIGATDLVRQLWLDNGFYGTTFSLQHKTENREIILGGGLSRYEGNHFGEIIWSEKGGIDKGYRWYDLDASKTDFNLFVKWQQQLSKKLTLFTDLQFRSVDYPINGFRNNPGLVLDNSWNFFNPKAGITYTRGSRKFYFSYAAASKEPNRDDFEASPEQQPGPEFLHDFELGFESRRATRSFGITGYYMLYRDQLVLTGKINDVGAYARTNIPNSYRMGLEATGSWKPNPWLIAGANLTVSQNKVKDYTEYYDDYDDGGQKSITYQKTDISFSPGMTGAYNLQVTPANGLALSLLGRYTGRQYLDNSSNKARSLDPFFVQDFRASYTIGQKLIREMGLSLFVYNLFDTKYEPNGYTYSYQYGGELITVKNYFPMAGINFMISLSMKF